MVEHVNGEESVSRFLIAPILDQDGGEVVCEVTNRFGRDSKIFLLSIEGIKKKIFFYLQFERKNSKSRMDGYANSRTSLDSQKFKKNK